VFFSPANKAKSAIPAIRIATAMARRMDRFMQVATSDSREGDPLATIGKPGDEAKTATLWRRLWIPPLVNLGSRVPHPCRGRQLSDRKSAPRLASGEGKFPPLPPAIRI